MNTVTLIFVVVGAFTVAVQITRLIDRLEHPRRAKR